MNRDPLFIVDTKQQIDMRDLLIWECKRDRTASALNQFQDVNPVVSQGAVVAAIFSHRRSTRRSFGAYRACDAETGVLLWHVNAGTLVSQSPIALERGILVVDKTMRLLDPRTGQPLWTAKQSWGNLDQLYITVGSIIFSTTSGELVKLDPESGNAMWRKQLWPGEANGSPGYTLPANRILCSDGEHRKCVDATTGDVIWSRYIPATYGGFRLCSDSFAVALDKSIKWISTEDGSILSESDWPGEQFEIASTASDKHLFVVTLKDKLVKVCKGNRQNPEVIRAIPIPGVKDATEWHLGTVPWAGTKLLYDQTKGILVETYNTGLNLTEPATGVREISIYGFPSEFPEIGGRIGLPTILNDRIYALTENGTILCLAYPEF